MSEEITVRQIFFLLPLTSLLTPLLFMLGEYLELTWDKYNSIIIYCCFAEYIYFAPLLHKKENWIMCLCKFKFNAFEFPSVFPLSIKSKLSLSVPFGRTQKTVVSESKLVPTYACILMPRLLHVFNRYMCVALTTTAHWWVPRPASLGCSPQPDARLPSCPSYCGGLFQCTPSPGPRTRWVAEPHKYFLSHSSRTQRKRNLYKFIWAFLCSFILLPVFTSAKNLVCWNPPLF